MKRWWWVGLIAIAAIIAIWLLLRPNHEDHIATGPTGGNPVVGRSAEVGRAGGPARGLLVPGWVAPKGMPAKRIAGIVTFEGARVSGATVLLTSWFTGAREISRITDASGTFDFGPQLPPGLTISANAPGRVGISQWVELRDSTAVPPPDAIELKLLGCAATVTGHVLDSSGGPIEKAQVVLDGTRVETDHAGGYRACAVLGVHNLRATADGYGGVHVVVAVSGDISRDVVLVPEIAITGRVIRAADGAPVADAVVTIMPAGAFQSDGPQQTTAVTDAEGRFRASGVPPGEVTAIAIAEDLTSQSAAKANVIVGQPAPELTIRMVGTLTVRGKVVGAGKPIVGVKVVAVRTSPLMYSRDSITQTDGGFVLDHVLPGDIVFKVTNYEVVSPASLPVAADRDGVVIEVAALGVIAGRTLRAGKLIPRVNVRLIGGGGNVQVTSDDVGHYAARGLAADTFKLSATATEAGAFSGTTEVKLAAAEHKENVDLDVLYGATISGVVVDQDAKPVANVFVRFMQPNGDLGESETGLDGSFRCHSMTGGAAYEPAVFPTRSLQRSFPWASAAPAIRLANGSAHVDGVRLEIKIVRHGIRGTVVDGNGAGIPDARVRAQPMGGTDLAFSSWLRLPAAITDATGAFAIADLAEGEYALQAHAPDGGEGTQAGVLTGATSAKIVVQRAASIDGTLIGFGEAPAVYAQSRRDPSRFVSAQIEGSTFSFRGLPPGPYTITAQSTNEGGAAHVDLAAGTTTKVSIESHGRGTITATLVPFNGGGGSPTGLVCHVVARAGDEAGITNWDPATSPRSDAQGRVTLSPSPAGDVFVQCHHQAGAWSEGQVATTLPKGGRVTVTIPVVKNLLPDDAANTGTIGVEFVSQAFGGIIASVQNGSPADRAGVAVGDAIVAVDGAVLTGLTPGGIDVLIQNHPIGSSIKLGVARGGTARVITVTVGPPH